MASITMGMNMTGLTVSKTYNSTDQDLTNMLAWGKVAFDPWIQAQFNPNNNPNFSASNPQIAAAIANSWLTGAADAEKKFRQDGSVAAVPPAPPAGWS
jgi:hypothetical protein